MLNKIKALIFSLLITLSLQAEEPSLFFLHSFLSGYKSNFGDALSPLIIERIIGRAPHLSKSSSKQLLGLGSILHYAREKDVIWGSGLNGKIAPWCYNFRSLDVRAVRGPRTRAFLLKRGIPCPEIYGDPALLMPILFPELIPQAEEEFVLIPNLNEIAAYNGLPHLVLPTEEPMEVVRRILGAKRVIAGSLHALIVAESFGIPAILLRLTEVEPLLKYCDYYEGTGRGEFPIAYSLQEALEMESSALPCFNREALLESFPFEYFVN